MVDAGTERKYPVDEVIGELVRLRSEFLAIDSLPDINGWSRRKKAVRKEGILHQFKAILYDYFPRRTSGTSINFNKSNYRWMPYWRISFDSSTLAGNSTNLGNIETVWLDNISDFLKICEEGASGSSLEQQDVKYQALKVEVEALIERFKSLIVSDEFL